jgi:hypothetical protein
MYLCETVRTKDVAIPDFWPTEEKIKEEFVKTVSSKYQVYTNSATPNDAIQKIKDIVLNVTESGCPLEVKKNSLKVFNFFRL